MAPVCRNTVIFNTILKLGKQQKLTSLFIFIYIAASCLAGTPTLAQAQSQNPAAAPQPVRVIVKLKPSLAQQAEGEFTPATPASKMHIVAGQARSASVQDFIRRHRAEQLSPMYPAIVHAKKQHGWSDAQFADNIRQRFATRARRQSRPVQLPELSRTYVLQLGQISTDATARALQQLKADPDVEFAEPAHSFSSKLTPNDPFLATSGTWGPLRGPMGPFVH